MVMGGAGRSLARSAADGADKIEEAEDEVAAGKDIRIGCFRLIPCKPIGFG
jgi:hypothetical protein